MKEDKKFVASYKRIKEDIIADILSGIYEKGARIQSQNYYSDKFQVSRTTVRNAFYELEERGVLECVKGKGTFVKNVDFLEKKEVNKLYDPEAERTRLKPSPTFHVVKIAEDRADYRLARQLGISEGDPVVCLERVRMVDKIAGNYQISFINKKLVEDIDFESEDMEKGSLYQVLINKAGLIPQYSDEMIRAVACPEHISQYFYIKKNDPILLISRTTYTIEGIVMEFCLDYECTDVNGLKIRR